MKYNCVYVAASVCTMAITKNDHLHGLYLKGKLKVILVASVRSVTIQAKSGLKDTIISDNEETLESSFKMGGNASQ